MSIVSKIIGTGLPFLFTIVTGGLLSLGKPVNDIILTIHSVTTIPTVIPQP